MKKPILMISLLVTLLFGFNVGAASDATMRPPLTRSATTIPFASKPGMIVLIVFDQFRADYLTRFQKRFLPAIQKDGRPGGFLYLMQKGAYFPFAEYDVLQSMTGPGHATLLTGGYPYQTGIPVNFWGTDTAPEYCVDDEKEPLVGTLPLTGPQQKGKSPRNLIGTTVGDELKNAGYPSRVVSISLKDRSAILMGGHRPDLSLWFDESSFQWVSSRYYVPDGKLPEWVARLNQKIVRQKGNLLRWEIRDHGTGYSLADSMILKFPEVSTVGTFFPHQVSYGSHISLAMPLGSELTIEAAESAIDAYKLGSGPAVDLLAVSFSSHDYLGHAFGPNSREMEEMTVSEDRALSRLLEKINKAVPGGISKAVIALTADHGIPSNPDWLAANKVPAGRFDEPEIVRKLNSVLESRFGPAGKEKWVTFGLDLNYYLNHRLLEQKKIAASEAEEAARAEILKLPGVAYVLTRSDYLARHLPPVRLERQIMKTYVPGRNGDLVLIPQPFYQLKESTVSHLTGYSYDRTVPLAISGFGIKPGVYATRAEIVDLAPTLSFLTRTIAPAVSEGRVLAEALK